RQPRNADLVDGCNGPRINPQRLYRPLIQGALKGWSESLKFAEFRHFHVMESVLPETGTP
ncbi:hypothetical protein, partial [Moorena sp. SIO4G3]|uniref:hypothetical protein n=1 Tax=Moorena sp. SIO4G3 TaxID=2607821 RepID=UPI0025E66E5F